MRLFVKLLAVALLTCFAQIGFDVVSSFETYVSHSSSEGVDGLDLDIVLKAERHLNSCNYLTRRIASTVMAIPFPGNAG